MARPTLSTLNVVVTVAGAVTLYAAIRNKNPIDVIKLSLTGKSLDTARPVVPTAPLYVDPADVTPPADGPVQPAVYTVPRQPILYGNGAI